MLIESAQRFHSLNYCYGEGAWHCRRSASFEVEGRSVWVYLECGVTAASAALRSSPRYECSGISMIQHSFVTENATNSDGALNVI